MELGNLPDGVSLAEGMEWGSSSAFMCPEFSWRLTALSLGWESSVHLQQGWGLVEVTLHEHMLCVLGLSKG